MEGVEEVEEVGKVMKLGTFHHLTMLILENQ